MKTYLDWFGDVAGSGIRPHAWQAELASADCLRSRVIRIPTGMGKTWGVFGAWSWHRLHRHDETWPRRLVWCLPMRVLVEQTEAEIRAALTNLGLLWDGVGEHAGKVGVHLLMGGVDSAGRWELFPEECAVLIGTQDMLLSRALNRGYSSGRARWPMDFGLLNHDALWVMDEVQLMDVGLATGAQLQAYLDDDTNKGFRPRNTWWMSATLQPEWLRSVDTEHRHEAWCNSPVVVPVADRKRGLGAIPKTLATDAVPVKEHAKFAERVIAEHASLTVGEHGRITLVVCNTVDRACRTFDEVKKRAGDIEVELVHSRFRPHERESWRARFLSRQACTPDSDRIIVATQVVEAGVDVSAGCVVTELAPWPSLVQRFGRCARYGETGRVVVVDRGRDEKVALPYAAEELEGAWEAIERIGKGGDAGTGSLEEFEERLDPRTKARLFPYEPAHLLLRREFDELFDTTPDLTGADLDISRFIRSGDERDLQVFWLNISADRNGPKHRPDQAHRPRRVELCAIRFLDARDWLCGKATSTDKKPRLRAGVRAWVWDWLEGEWAAVERTRLTPGAVVCVAADVGGYRVDRGFDSEWKQLVAEVPAEIATDQEAAGTLADDHMEGDGASVSEWKTIACHTDEVIEKVKAIAAAVALPPDLTHIASLAGRWHDVGKAHPVFQGAIRSAGVEPRPQRQDLAKAPNAAWLRPPGRYETADGRDRRRGFRHELASALALFSVLQRHQPRHPALLGLWTDVLAQTGHVVPDNPDGTNPTPVETAVLDCSEEQFDLLAYLVASHHGKVRLALHAAPSDQEYRSVGDGRGLPIRGVRDRDVLPPVGLDQSGVSFLPLTLSLEPAALGLSPITGRSWRERTLGLTERFGPAALAWLEAVFAAADRRASMMKTEDPGL